ncbi:hypothetical protein [Alicyclobacillus vulcanalis]|uniref:Uncharacterized protein n=1 Tax=Alicyclobacillus vulcanalis TaxID=252246 RepID=A0A1N7MAT2_9BACL|nr:hypothetical protein [Alicyclobacillus vulcanalis]SIS83152.1 hypothetical protein SAMN05421799_10511 [Alicyclobacillus vulcanalis]
MKTTAWIRIFQFQTLVVAFILAVFFLLQGQGSIEERMERHWWMSLLVMCLGMAAMYMKLRGWKRIYGYQGVGVAIILAIYLLFQGEGSVGQRIEHNWWISFLVALYGILQRRPTRYMTYKWIGAMNREMNLEGEVEDKKERNEKRPHA